MYPRMTVHDHQWNHEAKGLYNYSSSGSPLLMVGIWRHEADAFLRRH